MDAFLASARANVCEVPGCTKIHEPAEEVRLCPDSTRAAHQEDSAAKDPDFSNSKGESLRRAYQGASPFQCYLFRVTLQPSQQRHDLQATAGVSLASAKSQRYLGSCSGPRSSASSWLWSSSVLTFTSFKQIEPVRAATQMITSSATNLMSGFSFVKSVSKALASCSASCPRGMSTQQEPGSQPHSCRSGYRSP